MAYLYILQLSDHSCYCGITKDIVKRITDHQKGRSKSTRNKRPVIIKYLREFEDMSSARWFEVQIKRQGVSRWYFKFGSGDHNKLLKDSTANSQQPTAIPLGHNPTAGLGS